MQRRTKSVKRHYTECPEKTTIQRVSGNLRLSPYGLTSNFTKEKITGSNISEFQKFSCPTVSIQMLEELVVKNKAG